MGLPLLGAHMKIAKNYLSMPGEKFEILELHFSLSLDKDGHKVRCQTGLIGANVRGKAINLGN